MLAGSERFRLRFGWVAGSTDEFAAVSLPSVQELALSSSWPVLPSVEEEVDQTAEAAALVAIAMLATAPRSLDKIIEAAHYPHVTPEAHADICLKVQSPEVVPCELQGISSGGIWHVDVPT